MTKGCTLCPHECGVDRKTAVGFCRCPHTARVAKVMLHPWEEPCICSGNGAGAVFFSGCTLRCVYCQNHKISREPEGKDFSPNKLANTFLELQEKGASCVDLVSPTPYLESVIPALESAKKAGLAVPVVYNTSGYENASCIRCLDGLVDVYLPDLKYKSPALSLRYSGAADYFERASAALAEMLRQTGKPRFHGERLLSGVIVRHLVLPGLYKDSFEILRALFDLCGADGAVLSLMRQYVPCYRAAEFPEIDRKLTTLEYEKVNDFAEKCGFFLVYTQKKESAAETYIPDFLNNDK